MSYRFEDNNVHPDGPSIPARFQTMPPKVREAFDMERAKVAFWRGLTVAACVLGIVGILTGCAPQPEGYISAIVEYEH